MAPNLVQVFASAPGYRETREKKSKEFIVRTNILVFLPKYLACHLPEKT